MHQSRNLPFLKGAFPTDYEIQIIEAMDGIAHLLLSAQYSTTSSNIRCTYLLAMQCDTGAIRVLQFLPTVSHTIAADAPQHMKVLLQHAQRTTYVQPTYAQRRTMLSNSSVFSGDSLPFIVHPFLPVALTLHAPPGLR